MDKLSDNLKKEQALNSMMAKSMNNRIVKPIKQILETIESIKEHHTSLQEVYLFLKKQIGSD